MKPYVLAFSHIWPCREKSQGQPKVIIWTVLVVVGYQMLHTKVRGQWSFDSGEDVFQSFCHIWAWWRSWSCDPTHLYKFTFPFSHTLSCEIWFQMTQQFLRKTSFNSKIWVTFDSLNFINWFSCMLQPTLRHMAATFSRKYIIFSFVHTKAKVIKFNLGEKWVKVNPRS